MDKLTTSDKLILGGGIVYLIAMFLPWWGIDTGFGDYANNGWDYFLSGILPLILILVMCSHVLVSALSDTELPEPPVPWAQVHMGTGILAAVIVVLRLLIPSNDVNYLGINGEADLDRKFGLLLAVIAAIVVAVGGFKKSQEGDSTPSSGGTGSAPF